MRPRTALLGSFMPPFDRRVGKETRTLAGPDPRRRDRRGLRRPRLERIDPHARQFRLLASFQVDDRTYRYHRLGALSEQGVDLARLPFSLKILLENLLRNEDDVTVTKDDILGLANWDPKAIPNLEIAFRPSRVLLQDFTGVPAVVDLAAMRDAMKRMGGDPKKINPLQPVELVIDHSVQVDEAGPAIAFKPPTPTSNSPGTASGTPSSAGARTPSGTSGPSRPTPGSSTRSTSNTSPGSSSPRPTSRGNPPPTSRWPIPTPWSGPTRTPR